MVGLKQICLACVSAFPGYSQGIPISTTQVYHTVSKTVVVLFTAYIIDIEAMVCYSYR